MLFKAYNFRIQALLTRIWVEPSTQRYFRVKYQKTTYFLNASTTDKLSTVKNNLAKMLGDDRDPKRIRLSTSNFNNPPAYIALDKDNDTIEKLKLEDEQILFLSFWDENDRKWEPIQVEWPDPLVDDTTEDEEYDLEDQLGKVDLETGKGKAKARK
ncbi:hypothetical protein G9A89_004113 [Geosiphon pyriformis]|nr:hypothetical protein G9A89_004113 [Geosiphon pyriformis]